MSNAQYHKETDTYTYTEETTDPVRRDILSEISNTIWMNRKAVELLDSQGRHRSQWAYAPYDGRSWNSTTANKSCAGCVDPYELIKEKKNDTNH